MSLRMELVFRVGAKCCIIPSLSRIGWTATFVAGVAGLLVADDDSLLVEVAEVDEGDCESPPGTMFSRAEWAVGMLGCDSFSKNRTKACAIPSRLSDSVDVLKCYFLGNLR